MSHVHRNDDPPDQHDALEVQVQGEHFAWDENNRVYQYGGPGVTTERDDGYVFIGDLVPRDEPEYDPVKHLKEFAAQHLLSRRDSVPGAATDAGKQPSSRPRP